MPWADRRPEWVLEGARIARRRGRVSVALALQASTGTQAVGRGSRDEHRTHRWVSSERGCSTIRPRRRALPQHNRTDVARPFSGQAARDVLAPDEDWVSAGDAAGSAAG